MARGRAGEPHRRRWREHYNRTARQYDWKERLWGVLLGYSDTGERRTMIDKLQVAPGQRILEVSVGTGSNLLLAAGAIGPTGRMVGADISVGMLKVCRKKLARDGQRADLVESDAAHLPFRDESFDALLHFGAISLFGDKESAILEIVRVTKTGARLVIGDVGVRPEKRGTLRNRLLLQANSRYEQEPPTDLIEPHARDLGVTWFRGGTCFLVEFAKSA